MKLTYDIVGSFLRPEAIKNARKDFKEGKITEYTCTNFDSEEENKKYIFDNILHLSLIHI